MTDRQAERAGRGVITVVPLTSNIEKIYPFQVLITGPASGMMRDSKAQTEQVRAIAVDRVRHRMGSVPVQILGRIDTALRLHLAL